MKKSFLISLTLVVALISSLCGCAIHGIEVPLYSQVQEIFDRDKDSLLLIKNYFISTGYNDFVVSDDCETARVGRSSEIRIENEAIISALKELRSSGYSTIAKHGNTITFVVWTRLSDVGCGIAYSVDGKEISVDYLTKSEPLSETGWYYYVDDFNEWRRQSTE